MGHISEEHLPAVVLDDDGEGDASVGRTQVSNPAQETLAGTHRLWAHLHPQMTNRLKALDPMTDQHHDVHEDKSLSVL